MKYNYKMECNFCGTEIDKKLLPDDSSIELFDTVMCLLDISKGHKDYHCSKCETKTRHHLIDYSGALC